MTTIPQKFSDRYQLISQLGSGGMGAVFKAQDLKLKRLVALKIMHPSLAHNQNFRDRFLQEAQSAARLNILASCRYTILLKKANTYIL